MGGTGRLARITPAAAIACLLIAAPAAAKVRASITAWGEVAADDLPPDPAQAGTGLAPQGSLTHWQYLNHADHLDAALCRRFGATVRVVADGGDTMPDRVETRIHHPALTDQTGTTTSEVGFPVELADGQVDVAWTFDHPWEMQPGEWTIEFSLRGTVLARKSFTVTAPTGSGSICTGRPVA